MLTVSSPLIGRDKTMTTTTLSKVWKKYPFSVDGFDFFSRVDIHSEMGMRIALMPEDAFIALNKECVKDLIKGEWTRENLIAQLEIINAGGSQCFIELA